jgi:preprotein translocase subunit SecF
MNLPNIYQSKHYKKLIVIPIALLFIGLYFLPQIQLDSSLKGGITIQLQTNSSVDVHQITQQINGRIPDAEASVTNSPGGISVLIASNSSLSSALNNLMSVSVASSNYTRATGLVAQYQDLLTSQPGNSTLQAALSASQQNVTKYMSSMNSALSQELNTLRPLLLNRTYNYNSTDAVGIAKVAQSAYNDASAAYKNNVVSILQSILSFSSYTYNEVTPTLGQFFLSEMTGILVWSFVLIFIAVLFIFRNPVPAGTVVFGAVNDIIVSLGVMAVFGIPLGIASIGGLLMLVGYSIDTDMLSSVRILKRSDDTPEGRAYQTMKTGLTITLAAIITFAILLLASYLTFIPTYLEISGVVLAGLITDIVTTYCGNVPMTLWYKTSRGAKA